MSNVAAMFMKDKNFLKIFFSGTDWSMSLKLGIQHRALNYYQVCLYNDPRLTFEFFTERSTLVLSAFVWERLKW